MIVLLQISPDFDGEISLKIGQYSVHNKVPVFWPPCVYKVVQKIIATTNLSMKSFEK